MKFQCSSLSEKKLRKKSMRLLVAFLSRQQLQERGLLCSIVRSRKMQARTLSSWRGAKGNSTPFIPSPPLLPPPLPHSAFASLVLLVLDDFVKAEPRQSCSSCSRSICCSRGSGKNDKRGIATTGRRICDDKFSDSFLVDLHRLLHPSPPPPRRLRPPPCRAPSR